MLPSGKLIRLYEANAAGLLDDDLVDDVGWRLWERLSDVVARDGRPGALSELWHGLPGASARAGARRGRALSRMRLVRHSTVFAFSFAEEILPVTIRLHLKRVKAWPHVKPACPLTFSYTPLL